MGCRGFWTILENHKQPPLSFQNCKALAQVRMKSHAKLSSVTASGPKYLAYFAGFAHCAIKLDNVPRGTGQVEEGREERPNGFRCGVKLGMRDSQSY